MACNFGYGSSIFTLSSNNSVEWKGFRSREGWERSHTQALPCSCLGSSFASVASPKNLRAEAKSLAQQASVSSNRNELFSSFWGDHSSFGRLRSGNEKSGTLSRASAPMPLVEARLFGPSIFNASKLRVLLLGKDDGKKPLQHPRIYTLTHSDVTAKITLAVAREINKAQVMGWYSKLQRDEVVAEWRKTQGETSLHVHCHISGSNFLHKLIARLRFFIFQKELPLVLAAFMHGDKELFEEHPELQHAPVWVYFHSNVEEYNRVEYWGSLIDASKRKMESQGGEINDTLKPPGVAEETYFASAVCRLPCDCCSRHPTVIPIPESLNRLLLLQVSKEMPTDKLPSESS